VHYATVDGTAMAGSDYDAVEGDLTFLPGAPGADSMQTFETSIDSGVNWQPLVIQVAPEFRLLELVPTEHSHCPWIVAPEKHLDQLASEGARTTRHKDGLPVECHARRLVGATVGTLLAVRALLVADAGPEDGLGHVSRLSAVAVALASRGIETRCRAYGGSRRLERDGVTWEPWSPESPLPSDVDVAIVDSYRLEPETVVAATVPLVVFRDHGDAGRAPAALVVSVAAPPSDEPPHLSGPRYAALRPAYWNLPRRDVSGSLRHVLVTTGGGDPSGLGTAIGQAVAAQLPNVAVTLVRGPHAAASPVDGIEMLTAPESLDHLQRSADLVICGAGQTMLETAACGTPCIALVLAENQREQGLGLASAGGVVLVEPAGVDGVLAAIRDLDPAARQELSRRAQDAVDGRGALRIAHHVEELLRRPTELDPSST